MQQVHRVQSGAAESRRKKIIAALLYDTDVAPDVEDAIMKQIKRFGDATPDRIVNKPKLPAGLIFFLDAFRDLDTERTLTDLCPIPWSKIIMYGEYHGLNAEDVSDLLYLIREADNAYLRRVAQKRK